MSKLSSPGFKLLVSLNIFFMENFAYSNSSELLADINTLTTLERSGLKFNLFSDVYGNNIKSSWSLPPGVSPLGSKTPITRWGTPFILNFFPIGFSAPKKSSRVSKTQYTDFCSIINIILCK